MPEAGSELRLTAFDAEDLAILSLHLQDAVLVAGDMAYVPREHRFAVLVNRFDWATAITRDSLPGSGSKARGKSYIRRRAGLRFERVIGAKLIGIDLKAPRQPLSLLAIEFEETSPPAGLVTLVFAGGAAVRLSVECLEAELKDLGAAWATGRKPEHPEPESEG